MGVVRRFGERLSYANVMSTIAVFGMVLGGTAYAAGTIGSKDIQKNAVLSKHIKNGQVKAPDVAAGAISRAHLSPNAIGARAYVHVTRASGDFVVDRARTKNVVNVTLPSTGNDDRPCLVLPAWIDATKAVAIGSIDSANTPSPETASVEHRVDGESSQGCAGNSIALVLDRNGVGSSSTIAFNVMVP